jgi:hypothetical protein
LERKSATYHRAEADRTRRLLAEATTLRLKEHLEAAIAQHEQMAAKVERASQPDPDAASPSDRNPALSSETPGQ